MATMTHHVLAGVLEVDPAWVGRVPTNTVQYRS